MNYLPLGSHVSNLRDIDDTIQALIGLLGSYDMPTAEKRRVQYTKLRQKHRAKRATLLSLLTHDLNRLTPPLTIFGPHPVNESLWGVWIDLARLKEAEHKGKLVQSSYYPIKSRATYVLEVSEKGVKLFKRRGWKELWSA
jgi:hypothetical protein